MNLDFGLNEDVFKEREGGGGGFSNTFSPQHVK